MKQKMHLLCALAAAVAAGGGVSGLALAQAGAPQAVAGQEATGDEGSGGHAVELPILYVTSVEVLRTSFEPQLDIVRVTGVTGSQGWSGPQLVPLFVGKPLDDILDLQFIAATPEQSQKAEGFAPIGAVFTLEPGHPFKGVRVRASENTIEIKTIPGSGRAEVKVNDCKDCIGKKFAEKGHAQAGAQGVVREEDLPKRIRWLPPSRGIRGITHNPNRLNLVLGDDNTIIEAFWE
jgi:hypothetical protein